MFGTQRKFAWPRIAAASLVLITMGTALSAVVHRQVFHKSVLRSAAFIESLRQDRPEGVGAEEWNESVNITLTAFRNVCTYDPKNDKSKKIASELLSLGKSRPSDPLGKLRKIWEALYHKCNSEEKIYLDKMRKSMKQKAGLD
jgi:hypothetical protein